VKTSILMAAFGAMAVAGAGAALAADALPAGNAVAGQKVFNQCMGCHAVGKGAETGIGPVLNGVVGRKAGTAPGFRYSNAMKASGLTWDPATLARFVHAPAQTVPGTHMTFGGLAKPQDQADVIAYLKQYAADGTKK
jgi:cytochrome c